jgi:predicted ester cyclase
VSPTARTEQSVEEIARAYFDSVNSHDVNVMMDFWKPGGEAHIHGLRTLRAPEGYHEWFGALFRAVPDLEFETLDCVASGDRAAVRWRAWGTFDGEGKVEGVEPTGTKIDMEGIDLLRIEDGLIVENLAYVNQLEWARQMGVMPAQDSAAGRAMYGAANLKTRLAGLLKRD